MLMPHAFRLVLPVAVLALAARAYAQPPATYPPEYACADTDGTGGVTPNDAQRWIDTIYRIGREYDAARPQNVAGLTASVSGPLVTLAWLRPASDTATHRYIVWGGQSLEVPPTATTTTINPGPGTWSITVASRRIGAYVYAPVLSPPAVTAVVAGPPPPPALGWTDLTAPAGAQVFYVAANGSDSNPGTQAAPFRTIQRGYQALRDGQPDQLLLRCGDSWTLTDQVTITKGGSATHYQVIGSYGTGPRPKISAPQCAFRGESIGKRRIAFTGLDIICSNPREDSSCIILLGWKDILIEDCHLHEAGYPLVIQGFNTRSSGVKVRRNIITDANYPTSQAHARAVGFYMDLTDDWVIEENVFDRCGITGSIFGRPVYIQSDCSRGVYRENIMARSCAEGVQVRTGGVVHNNLSLRNPIGLFVGDSQPGTNDVQFNVVVESGDINTTDRRGIGLHINGPSIVKNNVLGYNTGTGWGSTKGIYLGGVTGECSNNYVWDWTRDPALGGPGDVHEAQGIHLESGSGSIVIANNTVIQIRPGIIYERSNTTISVSGSGNRYWWTPGSNQPFRPNSSAPGWTTIGSAMPTDPRFRVQDITGLTLEAFIAEARRQSRQNWRGEYTASGFNTLARARAGMAGP